MQEVAFANTVENKIYAVKASPIRSKSSVNWSNNCLEHLSSHLKSISNITGLFERFAFFSLLHYSAYYDYVTFFIAPCSIVTSSGLKQSFFLITSFSIILNVFEINRRYK